jgi:hypothetical protein
MSLFIENVRPGADAFSTSWTQPAFTASCTASDISANGVRGAPLEGAEANGIDRRASAAHKVSAPILREGE